VRTCIALSQSSIFILDGVFKENVLIKGIFSSLCNRLLRFKEGCITKKKVAIRDVAQSAEVSTATVSRYLNGKYHTMSAATRQRIEEIIKVLEYKPNDVARTLRSLKSKTIGVIMSNILNPYSVAILQGIEEMCSKSGYNIILCDTKESVDKEREFIDMMLAKNIDAFIINTTGGNSDLIHEISKEIPVVLVGRKIPGSLVDTIAINNQQGVCLAMNHLMGQGCQIIDMISPQPEGISPRVERIEAFCQFGRNDQQQSLNTSVHIVQIEDVDDVILVIQSLINKHGCHKHLGLIAANGVVSLAVLKAVRQLGYSIPQDFLLVGFDETDWASVSNPSLTVVAQPTYVVGERAAEHVMYRLQNNERSEPIAVELDVELISRDSTKLQ